MRFKFGPIDFTQPSTWRGVAGLAALFGIRLSPELTGQIAIALGAVLSAIELFRNEYSSPHAKAVVGEQSTTGPNRPVAPIPAAAVPVPDRLRPSVPSDDDTDRSLEPPGFGDR
mgnify:CR=1 FL=1